MHVTRSFLYATVAGTTVILAHSSGSSSDSSKISWTSPSSGEQYSSGDTITGKWNADKDIVSPSFKLCSDDGCGKTIWPDVKNSGDGSYEFSIVLPEFDGQAKYHLQMKDDFGKTFSSPQFDVAPSSSSDSSSPEKPPETEDVPKPQDESSPQVPLSAPTINAADANANGHVSPSSQSSPVPPPPPSALPSPGLARTAPVAAAETSRNSPPVAAIAVPLALVGAILLFAGALSIHHRRKLARERTLSEAAALRPGSASSTLLEAMSQSASSFSVDKCYDLEKSFLAGPPYAPAAASHDIFTPLPSGRHRSHRDGGQRGHSRSYRLPSFHFPSSSSRTRQTPDDICEGHDRRRVPWYEASSVTNDVLSTYLPTLGFDDIPLSPRLPPALCVRAPAPGKAYRSREGMEDGPDGGRASLNLMEHHHERELRNVYDAVARALGVHSNERNSSLC